MPFNLDEKKPLNNRKHELQIEGAREGMIDIYSFFNLYGRFLISHIKVQSNNRKRKHLGIELTG